MALSSMNTREKTVVAILGVIIVAALGGIGVLAAKLVTDGTGGTAGGITPGPSAPVAIAVPQETATLVTNPSLEGEAAAPAPIAAEPVAIAQVESAGALLPAILADQGLPPRRKYRVEVVAVDGSKVAIRGSWSQSAKSANGKLELPLPEAFEGTTPFSFELVPPLANPSSWSVSVSAAPQDLLGQPPRLVIKVWDVTGSQ
jgi:hypothetical protein